MSKLTGALKNNEPLLDTMVGISFSIMSMGSDSKLAGIGLALMGASYAIRGAHGGIKELLSKNAAAPEAVVALFKSVAKNADPTLLDALSDSKRKKLQAQVDAALPSLVRSLSSGADAMNRNQKAAWWRRIGEALGVLNANPEGHNQYSSGGNVKKVGTKSKDRIGQDSTNDANAATDKANKEGGRKSHEAAAKMHYGAAAYHRGIGDAKMAGEHTAAGDMHQYRADSSTRNANPNRHNHTGQYHAGVKSSAVSGYDNSEPREMGQHKISSGDDGRDTMLGKRVNIDIDGDGDGPIDDDDQRKEDEAAASTMPPPNQPSNQGTNDGSDLRAAAARSQGRSNVNLNARKEECPECGGEMEEDEDGDMKCEDCGYKEDDDDTRNSKNTRNAFGAAPTPPGGGTVQGQPNYTTDQAHAVTQQAAQASMDHPPARGPAVKALDHSAAGKSNFAAKQHGAAADAHDDAAGSAMASGDTDGADKHYSAASLHKKAAAMHQVLTANTRTRRKRMTANDFDEVMKLPFIDLTTNQGRTKFATFVTNVVNSQGGSIIQGATDAGYPADQAAAMAGKVEGSYGGSGAGSSKAAHAASDKAKKEGTKGAHKAAGVAHRKAAKVHGDSDVGHMHGVKAKQHDKAAARLSRNEAQVKTLIANGVLSPTDGAHALGVLNAKVDGSNADSDGSGDFEDAIQVGGEAASDEGDPDNDTEEIGYQSASGDLDPWGVKDETDKDTTKTAAGATDKTRGRVGNRRMTENQWLASAPPGIREVVRNAMIHDQQVRRQLIARIVEDVPAGHRQHIVNSLELGRKSIRELQTMLQIKSPRPTENEVFDAEVVNEFRQPNYMGQGFLPAITDNSTSDMTANASDDVACMVPEVSGNVLNFRQIQNEERGQRQAR